MSKVTRLVNKEMERRRITAESGKNLLGVFIGHKEMEPSEKQKNIEQIIKILEKYNSILDRRDIGNAIWGISEDDFTVIASEITKIFI